jgi:6-phosphogluconolactonase
VLITGESKWRTFKAACAAGPVEEMPIRAVLRQSHTPVDVMWSP